MMKIPRTRDYSRIKYYIDAMGRIWHGPFSPETNLHYKLVDSVAISHSYLPPEAVEITPYQAAQHIRWLQEMTSPPKARNE
jgi:hypothetical protein